MDRGPELHAVIECPYDVPSFVGDVPPRPRPQFIRLSGESPGSDVALVVAQLVRYGHGTGDGPRSMKDLVADFPQIAPGGLAAVDGPLTVHPSCCCGIESWREWYGLLNGDGSPWLGHDPSPWVERRGEEFLVWPNGGLGEAPHDDAPPIRFSMQALAASLADAERDLAAFASRLRDWASVRAPDHAQALMDGFRALAKLSVTST